MIAENLMIKYQAELKDFNKEDILFKSSSLARYYYQIHKGEVKVSNMNSDGKEFIQYIFSKKGRGIGEPALLGGFKYPANCMVTKPSKIWVLKKKDFFKLLEENVNTHFEMSKIISERLYFKSIMAYENTIENSEHRILTLLNYLKTQVYNKLEPFEYQVELSRQEIGNLTGLRVETVIRTIKKLEKNNSLKLIHRKIYI